MTDWIDKRKQEHDAERVRQQYHAENFGPTAYHIWEVVVGQIQRDVDKLNSTPGLLIGKIRVNGRELIPGGGEVDLDRLEFPAIYLTVRLDVGARSIAIDQRSKATPEGEYVKSNDRLELDLADSGPFNIKDRNGKVLDIAQVSQYLLERFLT